MNRRAVVFVVLGIVAAYSAMAEWSIQLRFADPVANGILASLLVLAIPVSLAWFLASLSVRRASTMALAVLLVGTTAGAIIIWMNSAFIQEPATLVAETRLRRAYFRLYEAETDCGAPCGKENVLRRERDLPLGIRLTQKLWTHHPAIGDPMPVRTDGISKAWVEVNDQTLD